MLVIMADLLELKLSLQTSLWAQRTFRPEVMEHALLVVETLMEPVSMAPPRDPALG